MEDKQFYFLSRSITNVELLLCYSIKPTELSNTLNNTQFDATIDDLLPSSVPCSMCRHILQQLIVPSDFTLHHFFGSEEHVNSSQCYVTSQRPDTLDWTKAYKEDPYNKVILHKLRKSKHSDTSISSSSWKTGHQQTSKK